MPMSFISCLRLGIMQMSEIKVDLSDDILRQIGLGSAVNSPDRSVRFEGNGSIHVTYSDEENKQNDFVFANKLDSEKVDLTNEKQSLIDDIDSVDKSLNRVRIKFYVLLFGSAVFTVAAVMLAIYLMKG